MGDLVILDAGYLIFALAALFALAAVFDLFGGRAAKRAAERNRGDAGRHQ